MPINDPTNPTPSAPTSAPAEKTYTLDEYTDALADKYAVPKTLLRAMTGVESGGNTSALSPKGAKGRFQVMPDTAKQYGANPDDPFDNAFAGVRYLRDQYDAAKKAGIADDTAAWNAAVAGYHAGPKAVNYIAKNGGALPPKTKEYWDGGIYTADHVQKVAGRWARLEQQANPDTPAVDYGALNKSYSQPQQQPAQQPQQPAQPADPRLARLQKLKQGLNRVNVEPGQSYDVATGQVRKATPVSPNAGVPRIMQQPGQSPQAAERMGEYADNRVVRNLQSGLAGSLATGSQAVGRVINPDVQAVNSAEQPRPTTTWGRIKDAALHRPTVNANDADRTLSLIGRGYSKIVGNTPLVGDAARAVGNWFEQGGRATQEAAQQVAAEDPSLGGVVTRAAGAAVPEVGKFIALHRLGIPGPAAGAVLGTQGALADTTGKESVTRGAVKGGLLTAAGNLFPGGGAKAYIGQAALGGVPAAFDTYAQTGSVEQAVKEGVAQAAVNAAQHGLGQAQARRAAKLNAPGQPEAPPVAQNATPEAAPTQGMPQAPKAQPAPPNAQHGTLPEGVRLYRPGIEYGPDDATISVKGKQYVYDSSKFDEEGVGAAIADSLKAKTAKPGKVAQGPAEPQAVSVRVYGPDEVPEVAKGERTVTHKANGEEFTVVIPRGVDNGTARRLANQEIQKRGQSAQTEPASEPQPAAAPDEARPQAPVIRAQEAAQPASAEQRPAAAAEQPARPLAADVDGPRPAWLSDNVKTLAGEAERTGLADKIEELAAQRKTAKQIASELGTDVDTVRAVRERRGIPPVNEASVLGAKLGSGSEAAAAFEAWLQKRNQSAPAETSQPAAAPKLRQPLPRIGAPVRLTKADEATPTRGMGEQGGVRENVRPANEKIAPEAFVEQNAAKTSLPTAEQPDALRQEALSKVGGKFYHGTDSATDFDSPQGGSFFTTNRARAHEYSQGAIRLPEDRGNNPRVYEASLDIKNPYVVRDHVALKENTLDPARVEELKRQGYDSVVGLYPDGDTVAVPFDGAQVKSNGKQPAEQPKPSREQVRLSVEKGEHGQFSAQARKSQGETESGAKLPALAEHPELRNYLGLGEMPKRDEQGKTGPEWAAAAQETLDALAQDLGGVPRSSHLSPQHIEDILASHGPHFSDGLRDVIARTAAKAGDHASRREAFVNDKRVQDAVGRMADAFKPEAKRQGRDYQGYQKAVLDAAREHGISERDAREFARATVDGIRKGLHLKDDVRGAGERAEGQTQQPAEVRPEGRPASQPEAATGERTAVQEANPEIGGDARQRILDALSDGEDVTLDAILKKTGLNSRDALKTLLEMEMDGAINERPGKAFRLTQKSETPQAAKPEVKAAEPARRGEVEISKPATYNGRKEIRAEVQMGDEYYQHARLIIRQRTKENPKEFVITTPNGETLTAVMPLKDAKDFARKILEQAEFSDEHSVSYIRDKNGNPHLLSSIPGQDVEHTQAAIGKGEPFKAQSKSETPAPKSPKTTTTAKGTPAMDEAMASGKPKKDKLGQMADDARARQRKNTKSGKVASGFDPADLVDHAVIAADDIRNGARDFAEWSKGMVRKFGDEIKPHLRKIFDRATKIADSDARLEGLQERYNDILDRNAQLKADMKDAPAEDRLRYERLLGLGERRAADVRAELDRWHDERDGLMKAPGGRFTPAEQKVLDGIRALSSEGPDGLVTMHALRPKTGLGKDEFDAAVMSLAKDYVIDAMGDPAPGYHPPDIRAALVKDEHGNSYIAASLRDMNARENAPARAVGNRTERGFIDLGAKRKLPKDFDAAKFAADAKRKAKGRGLADEQRAELGRTINAAITAHAKGDAAEFYKAQSHIDRLTGETFGKKAAATANLATTAADLLNLPFILTNSVSHVVTGTGETASHLLAASLDAVYSKVTGKPRVLAAPRLGDFTSGVKAGTKEAKHFIGRGEHLPSESNWHDTGLAPEVMKPLEKALRYVNELPDHAAWSGNFNREYQAFLRANKNATMEQAIEYATHEANLATFKDKNVLRKSLETGRKFLNAGQEFGLADVVGLRYTGVPSGIATRAIEYSPAGFYKAYRVFKKGGDVARAAGLKMLSRAILGTAGPLAAGALLGAVGVFSSGDDDNRTIAAAEREANAGGYKLNLSAFSRWLSSGLTEKQQYAQGDKIVSLDWAQPFATTLAVGAAMHEAWKEKGGPLKAAGNISGAAAKSIEGGVKAFADNTVVSRALQSLAKLGRFGDIKEATKGFLGGVVDLAKDYPGRILAPQQFNLVAKSLDPTKRDVRADDIKQEILNRWKARFPAVSESLPARPGVFGQEVNQLPKGETAANLFRSNVDILKTRSYQGSPIITEMQRVNRALPEGAAKVTPPAPKRDKKNGETLPDLRARETATGRLFGRQGQALLGDAGYRALPDALKAKAWAALKGDLSRFTSGQAEELRDASDYVERAVSAAEKDADREEERKARRRQNLSPYR